MLKAIGNNKAGIALLILAIAFIVFITASQGCAIYDFVKMKNPPAVADATGTPSAIPLTDAPYVRDQYVTDFTRNLERFDAEYDKASLWADLLASGLNLGVQASAGPLATVPGGAIIFGVLAGAAGLMTRKPGTDSEIQREKEDSHNHGYELAIKTLRDAGVNVPAGMIKPEQPVA